MGRFMRRLRAALVRVGESWRDARVSKAALGKYIILYASLLHLGWAALLMIDPSSGESTPVAVLSRICGGPVRTAFVLTITAIPALAFPFVRFRVTNRALALMLLPQQLMLLMSAGGGIAAVVARHYADGVARPWGFILADQLPVILAAALYTAAVLEASFDPTEEE